jgi:hypothetical protein
MNARVEILDHKSKSRISFWKLWSGWPIVPFVTLNDWSIRISKKKRVNSFWIQKTYLAKSRVQYHQVSKNESQYNIQYYEKSFFFSTSLWKVQTLHKSAK